MTVSVNRKDPTAARGGGGLLISAGGASPARQIRRPAVAVAGKARIETLWQHMDRWNSPSQVARTVHDGRSTGDPTEKA